MAIVPVAKDFKGSQRSTTPNVLFNGFTVLEDDLIIISYFGNGDVTMTTPPVGYTLVDNALVAPLRRVFTYFKFAGAGESNNPGGTWSAQVFWCSVGRIYRGVDKAAGLEDSQISTGSGFTMESPTLTISAGEFLGHCVWAADDSSTSFGTPESPYTLVQASVNSQNVALGQTEHISIDAGNEQHSLLQGIGTSYRAIFMAFKGAAAAPAPQVSNVLPEQGRLIRPVNLNYQSRWAPGLNFCMINRRSDRVINEVRNGLKMTDGGHWVANTTVMQGVMHGMNVISTPAAVPAHVDFSFDQLGPDNTINQMVMAALVKLDTVPSTTEVIMAKRLGDAVTPADTSWELAFTSTGAFRAFCTVTQFGGFPVTVTGAAGTFPIDNNFHWVISKMDPQNNVFKIYIDGILHFTGTGQGGFVKESFGQTVSFFAGHNAGGTPVDFMTQGQIAAAMIWTNRAFSDDEILQLFGPGGGGGLDDLFDAPMMAIDDFTNPSPAPAEIILVPDLIAGEGTLLPAELTVTDILVPDLIAGAGLLLDAQLLVSETLVPDLLAGEGTLLPAELNVTVFLIPDVIEAAGQLLDAFLGLEVLDPELISGTGLLLDAELNVTVILVPDVIQGAGEMIFNAETLEPDVILAAGLLLDAELTITEILVPAVIEGAGLLLDAEIEAESTLLPVPILGAGLLLDAQILRDVTFGAAVIEGAGLLIPAEIRVISPKAQPERLRGPWVRDALHMFAFQGRGCKQVPQAAPPGCETWKAPGTVWFDGTEDPGDTFEITAIPYHVMVTAMIVSFDQISPTPGVTMNIGTEDDPTAFFKGLPVNAPAAFTYTQGTEGAFPKRKSQAVIVSFVAPAPNFTFIYVVSNILINIIGLRVTGVGFIKE